MTGLAIAAFTGTLVACDLGDALDVDAPSRIPAGTLETPANATLLVNSAIGDFECAYGAYVVAGGLIGEESVDGLQTADRYPYDRRSTQPSDRRYAVSACEAVGVYTPMQTARVSAENVIRLLNTWTDAEVPNRAQLIATASAHAGYALLMLGEGFCSVVISNFDENQNPVLGGTITRDSVFKLAEARFTDALGSADVSIKNMALLGRAKARQDLGRLADARADAIQVPATYERNITASATPARRQNKVWADGNANARGSLVGEPYRSMTDPRVKYVRTAATTVTGIPVVYQTKYPESSSPLPFATGDEAQFIVAEADLAAGNLTSALAIINTFRVRAGFAPFASTSATAIKAELVEQRRREFFLEGQHLGDLIRYQISPQPAAGATYHGSGVYGNQLCLPLPDAEKTNNPNAG
jgi:starch-binding outer membrane protein, SusD/RagB family